MTLDVRIFNNPLILQNFDLKILTLGMRAAASNPTHYLIWSQVGFGTIGIR